MGKERGRRKINVAKAESVRLANQKLDLLNDRKSLLDAKGLGVDSAEDKRLRDKAVLEREIRNQGVQALQSTLSPERGLQVGQQELKRLQLDQAQAEKDAPLTAIERREINAKAKKAVLPSTASAAELLSALGDLQAYQPTTKAAQLDQDATLRTTLREGVRVKWLNSMVPQMDRKSKKEPRPRSIRLTR